MALKKALIVLVIATCFILTGCREVLYSNLTEDDANEMLQTLLVRGVDAKKVNGAKDSFNIEVAKEDLVRALKIIKEHSLPKEQFASLGTVFSNSGMISSQTEEQARLCYAIAQELSATFSHIDGVLDAKVHVVLAQHNIASGITTPPSASVFIRHTKNSPVTNLISGIKDTVSKAVPGLDLKRVSVLTQEFNENIIKPSVKSKAWYENTLVIIACSFAAFILLTAIVVFILKQRGYITLNLGKHLSKKTK